MSIPFQHNQASDIKKTRVITLNSNWMLLAKQYILLLLLMAIFRLINLLVFAPTNVYTDYVGDIIWAFLHGVRFDSVVILYCMLPVTIMHIISILFIPLTDKLFIDFGKWMRRIMNPIVVLLYIALMVDVFYFDYYKKHFDISVFGLWEDDTVAILKSIYSDIPWVWFVVLSVGGAWITLWLNNKLYKRHRIYSFSTLSQTVTLHLVYIALFIVGIRGSVEARILCLQDHGVISAHSYINELMLNGLFTLREAVEQRYDVNVDATEPDILSSFEINDKTKLLTDYAQLLNNDTSIYWKTTDTNTFLQKHPPNILVLQMESFGGELLKYQSPDFDLLGAFKSYYDQAIKFQNFKCSNVWTMHTLEATLLNVLMTPVSHSKNYTHHYKSNNLNPYIQHGYKTSFITGSTLSWHSINKFLPSQGFEDVIGLEGIFRQFPNGTQTSWGVTDEYIFKYLLHYLKIKSQKPKLVYGMTISNHAPFDIANHYQPEHLTPPASLMSKVVCDKKVALKSLIAYRYANDYLGKFLAEMEKEGILENTIVAITGDHFCRDILDHSDNEFAEKFSVPFVLLVPKKYRQNWQPDYSYFSSHKDIFPTLFHLSLSNSKYFSSGNNLLDSITKKNQFSFTKTTPQTNDFCLMTASGYIVRYQGHETYYQWEDDLKTKGKLLSQKPEFGDWGRVYNAALNVFQSKEQKEF